MDRRTLLRGLGGAALMAQAPGAWAQGAQGRWMVLESPNFQYFATGDEARAREEVAAVEGFDALLKRLMPSGHYGAIKLTIHATPSQEEFEIGWPGSGDTVMGFYQAHIEQVRAVLSGRRPNERQRDMPRNLRAMDARTALFHEYAHHYMRASDRLSYPAWYTEGFAEYTSTVDFTSQGAVIGKATQSRHDWTVYGKWMDINSFLTRHPGSFSNSGEVAQFYAQAWLAAHYLFSTPKRAQGFDNYARALMSGGDAITSFEPSFGITPEAFDLEMRNYRKGPLRYSTVPDMRPVTAGTTMRRLGKAADNLLLPVGFLRSGPSVDEAREVVAGVREEVKKFPDDLYALQCLALAEVWYGDLNDARSQIDRLLPLDERNPEIHHLSGLCDLRAGRKENDKDLLARAQKSFGRAHGFDNVRPQSLFRYAEAGMMLTGIDEHLVDVLVDAYNYAPQVDYVALTTAQALIQHERFEEAVAVLQPLTADVHGGGTAEFARELLSRSRKEERVGFAFFGAAMVEGE
jgi:hypothetical protein